MTILCSVCNCSKDSSEFYRSLKYKTGFFSSCKDCYNKLHPKRKRQPKIYSIDEIVTPTHKTCSHCKELKLKEEFYPSKRYKTGLMSQCKSCKSLLHVPRAPKTYSIEDTKYVEYKQCKDCKQTKPTVDFYVSKRSKDGFVTTCKPCYSVRHPVNQDARREYFNANKDKFNNARIWRIYGITLKDYNNMLISQNHCCAICSISVENLNRMLDIDHCHKTGKVRGLLCNRCNKFLNMIDVNDDILEKIRNYVGIQTIINK